METFFTHLWKSAIIVSLFYGFYKLFIQKETYFSSIRYFLLSGVILSILIPFVSIIEYIEVAPIQIVPTALDESIIPFETASIDWLYLGVLLYALVAIGLLLKFILQLLSIASLIYKHSYVKIDGCYLVKTHSNTSPFSFFNFIVYNPAQFHQEEVTQVLAHEKAHVLQMHSIDNLMANLLVIFLWFNPIAWFYKHSITQNLEYIADEYAQKKTHSPHSYQQLLLKTTIPNYKMALANNFYNSLLKKRIIMLHKQRSKNHSQWKFLTILPVLCTFVFAFNTETIAQQKKTSTKILEVKADIFAMALNKESSEKDLKKISSTFLEKGLIVKFSNIKRNSSNEITALKINAKTKNGKSSASHAANVNDGIHPIQISYDSESNYLSIGSAHNNHQKEYISWTKDKGTNFVFVSDDDDKNVWVTKKDGKKIVVESHYDEDDDHDTEVVRITTDKDGKKNKTMVVSTSNKARPLIILDGKEITSIEMEDLDTDDIESINVLKGKKAKAKYGDKGKNGVIEITSKK